MSGFGGGYDTGVSYGGGGYGGYSSGGVTSGSGYGSSMYDGAGGGYMDGGTGNSYAGGAGDEGSRSRMDSLQPVTVKQLLGEAKQDSNDDRYSLNGVELGLVTLVGRIMSCEVQVTMITLKLDDCTGVLNVVYVIDPEQDEYSMQKRRHIKDLAWIRIIGKVREVDGVLQVDAVHVRGIEDMNEFTYHRLEVVSSFLAQTRPRPSGSFGTTTTPVRHGMANVSLGGSGRFSTGVTGPTEGLTEKETAVYHYIRQRFENGDVAGVSITEIARNVPGFPNEDAVRSVMEVLASDGSVYSTVDEDHFAYCRA